MRSVLALQQLWVRGTLSCLALATMAAIFLVLANRLSVVSATSLIGQTLLVTALAQGVLSWIAEFCNDLDCARSTVLGAISTFITAGTLLAVGGILS